MELSTEKQFQYKPVPSSIHAKVPVGMTQKYGLNYLLDNWNLETNEQHDMSADET